MDYKKIEKVHAGKFLDYYNVTYVDGAGNEKVYEMVSNEKKSVRYTGLARMLNLVKSKKYPTTFLS